jgi:hypothetical protein
MDLQLSFEINFWGKIHKTLFFVTFKWTQKARAFVPGRLLLGSQMFVIKAGAYRAKNFQVLHTGVGTWPCPQASELAGWVSQEQTL